MRVHLTVCAALAAGALVPLPAANATTRGAAAASVVRGSPVIAVLDTGVRATHEAFDYRGPRSTSDQIVAWWDFTADRKAAVVTPRRGQLWDTSIRDPYDDEGHGTAVASMVAGLRRPHQDASAAPGYQLAIGKVYGASNSAPYAAAFDWAVHTVHASVINLSFADLVPAPSTIDRQTLDAIDAARRAGVLVVVGNGNGWANASLPGEPGWATAYSSSTSVLAVGASEPEGALLTTDPEVTTRGNVSAASNAGDHRYATVFGTSFAAPYIAGFAARLVSAARTAHRRPSPDYLRRLIEYVAVDTDRPPATEGYGAVSAAQLPVALARAQAGKLPTRPQPDDSGWYVEHVAMPLRDLWTNKLRGVAG